jgi:formate dehydrogenase iron-sulfur subunit
MAQKTHPKAKLLDPDDIRVIFLVTEAPKHYHTFAVASSGAFDMSRAVALKRLLRPFTSLTARLS